MWVTKRWRTRATVSRLVPRASTMSSSGQLSPWESARSRTRAWVSLRAAALPAETMCSRAIRSSAVSVTRYLSIAGFLLPECLALSTPQETGTPVTCQMKIDEPLAFGQRSPELQGDTHAACDCAVRRPGGRSSCADPPRPGRPRGRGGQEGNQGPGRDVETALHPGGGILPRSPERRLLAR